MKTESEPAIVQVTLVVRDYDEAIAFYTQVMGFELMEDTVQSEVKRWVVVRPKGSHGCSLLLAKAATPEQIHAIGNQTGGRVAFFLHTKDILADYKRLQAAQVRFIRPLSYESYGAVTVFEDLYGNLWDLIQPPSNPTPSNPT